MVDSRKRGQERAFPDVIRIESAGICNFECIHCPNGYKKTRVKRGLLNFEIFNLLLDQFKKENFIPRVVVLYHGGEPLLNKNLPEMIATLKSYGVKKTVITTNVSLLTTEMSMALVDAGLDEMKVSVDGNTPEENDKIRINCNYELFEKNLVNFLQINKHTHVIIANTRICKEDEIRLYINGGHLRAPKYLHDTFEKYGQVDFFSNPARVWPVENIEKFLPYKILHFESPKPNYCSRFYETMTILANGDVVPCCDDLGGEAVLGSILKDTIFNIRGHSLSQKFFDAFEKGDVFPEICQKCFLISQRYLSL